MPSCTALLQLLLSQAMNFSAYPRSKRLVSVLDPLENNNVVNKKYVDNNLKTQGNKVISSNLDVKTYEIIYLAPGTDSRSAVK